MRFLPAWIALTLACPIASAPPEAPAKPQQHPTYIADGFDLPVGKPDAEGYYKARGYRANGHLGEDWNGKGGGDSDLGDGVYAIAHGIVLYAQNFGHGWGNVVIIRHVFEEDGEKKFVDSLYGHLDQIQTRYGLHVRRGQQIGTIGTGGGLYDAHLHFEIRKDLRVGMARHRFPRDGRTYVDPTAFILARRQLSTSGHTALVPVNTFVQFNLSAAAEESLATEEKGFIVPGGGTPVKKDWKPSRYDDLKR